MQARITAAQQRFQRRSRAMQQEGQLALGHVRQTIVAVVRQLAESRGTNLVIEGKATALHTSDFDITKETGERVNEVLPTVKQFMVEGSAPRG